MKTLKYFTISFLLVASLSASQDEFPSENQNWIDPLCASIGELAVPTATLLHQNPISSQSDKPCLSIQVFESNKRIKKIEDGEAEIKILAEEARVEALKYLEKRSKDQKLSLQTSLERRVKDLEDESVRLRKDIEEEKEKKAETSCIVS